MGLIGEPRIVYINGTGSGKSLVFFLSSYILPGKCHVIFVLLNALKDNLVDRARAVNLKTTIWKANSESMVDENVVFVSYENLVKDSFTDWVKKKKRINSIERIYIDEVYVIVTQSSWRYIMRYMVDVNLLGIFITFLAATFTREIELLLKKEMKLPDSDTRLIRGSIKRKNIHYSAIGLRFKSYQIDVFKRTIHRVIDRLIENGRFSINDLTLIFTRGLKAQIQLLAEEFGFEYYFSNRSNHAQILTDFKAGKITTLVISNALLLGLDLPNIRAVFHIGKSTSLIDFS